MWIFVNEKNPEWSYGLTPGQSYTLGRAAASCDIAVKDDVSISRKHGELRVVSDEEVRVIDSKSTFGTYVGERAIATSATGSQEDRLRRSDEEGQIVREDGTRIRFGLHSSIFRLEKRDLIVTTSALSRPVKQSVKKILLSPLLKGTCLDDWSSKVTHLVMKEVILTIKVANALASCIPIVTPEFLVDLEACLRSKQILPDPKNYIPALKESSLNPNSVSLDIDPSRKVVFRSKTFVFASESEAEKFRSAVTSAGGSVIFLEDEEEEEEEEKNLSSSMIFIKSENPSRSFEKAVEKFASGRQLIPESQIGLAILFSSTEIYCNPDYKPSHLVQKLSQGSQKNPLVPETQLKTQKSQGHRRTDETRIIPPTNPEESGTTMTFPESHSKKRKSDDSYLETQKKPIVPETQLKTQKSQHHRRTDETRVIPPTNPEESGTTMTFPESKRSKKTEKLKLIVPETQLKTQKSQHHRRTDETRVIPPTNPEESAATMTFLSKKTEKRKPDDRDIEPQKRRRTQEPEDEEDLFGFVKEEEESKTDGNDVDEEDLFGFVESKTEGNEEEDLFAFNEKEPKKRTRIIESDDENETKRTKNRVHYGFISKSSSEKKENGELSELTRSYCKLEIVDLARKSPAEVRVEKSLGKPVKNFKLFKRKSIPVPSSRITDFQLAEDRNKKSVIDNWLEETRDMIRQNESESQEAEEFWKFQTSQSSKASNTSKSRRR